jgi:hypothetical protein
VTSKVWIIVATYVPVVPIARTRLNRAFILIRRLTGSAENPNMMPNYNQLNVL